MSFEDSSFFLHIAVIGVPSLLLVAAGADWIVRELLRRNETIAFLSSQVEAVEENKTEYRKLCNALESELNDAKEYIESLEEAADRYDKQRMEANDSVKDLSGRVSDLEVELSDARNYITTLEQQNHKIVEYRDKIDELEECCERQRSCLDQIRDVVKVDSDVQGKT